MRSVLTDLSDDIASWHPAGGEWCIKECLGHMLEAEARGFAGRIRRILETPGLEEAGWDQEQVQRDRNDDSRSLSELLQSFLAMRVESLELVASLVNTDLDKGCIHAQVGELRIEDLLHEWVHHDQNHFRQLLANLQAYVWPAMGNGRRFAEVD